MMNNRYRQMITLLVVMFATGLVIAQQSDPAANEASQESTSQSEQTAPEDKTQQSATDLMEQLKKQRREMPAIKPTDSPLDKSNAAGPVEPAATVDIDESVLGTAPGMEPPKLRREGEFLRNRRGRLLRAEQSGHVLFVFEADSQDSPERPMVLVPCQRLQEMEELAQLRDESMVFVISGQVLVYRGVNYLLPRMVKLDTNRGNLNN